jgi:uncharacterized protein
MKGKIIILALVLVFAAAAGFGQSRDFYWIVKTGTPQQVQEAIDAGADVNAVSPTWNMTPMALAASYNENPGVVVALVKAGAALAPNEEGWTPLMAAAWSNMNPQVAAALIDLGVDVNSRYMKAHGRTALMFAAEHSLCPEVILALLKGGADARQKDTDGKTALDLADHNYPLKHSTAFKQLQEASD